MHCFFYVRRETSRTLLTFCSGYLNMTNQSWHGFLETSIVRGLFAVIGNKSRIKIAHVHCEDIYPPIPMSLIGDWPKWNAIFDIGSNDVIVTYCNKKILLSLGVSLFRNWTALLVISG